MNKSSMINWQLPKEKVSKRTHLLVKERHRMNDIEIKLTWNN